MTAEPILAAKLRTLVVVAGAVAVLLGILAFLPGARVYADANRCHAQQVAACVPDYSELVGRTNAGGGRVVGLLVLLLVPGLALYATPTRRAAWFWFAWVPITGVIALAIEVTSAVAGAVGHLGFAETRTESTPNATVFLTGGVGLAVLVMLGIAWLAGGAPRPLPAPPEARVVRRGDADAT